MPLVVEATTEGGVGSSSASFTATAPSTVNADDLLILAVSTDSAEPAQESSTTDWTLLSVYNSTNQSRGSLHVFYHWADGTEDSENWTFNLTDTGTETAAWEMLRISGADTGTNPEAGSGSNSWEQGPMFHIPHGDTSRVTTPDHADFAPPATTAAFDVRAEFTAVNQAAQRTVLSQWTASNQGFVLCVGAVDWKQPRLYWSSTGSDTLSADATTTMTIDTDDRVQMRAVLVADNGSSNRTIDFYYKVNSSDDLTSDTGWTTLGTQVTGAVTSIYNSTAEVAVGRYASGTSDQYKVQVFQAAYKAAGTTKMWADFRSGDWSPGVIPTQKDTATGSQDVGDTQFTADWSGTTAAVGDLVIVHCVADQSGATITDPGGIPSGWNVLINEALALNYAYHVSWKIFTAADVSAGSATFGTGESSDYSWGLHVIQAGTFNASSPFNGSDFDEDTTPTGSNSPSVTTTVDNTLILIFGGSDGLVSQTMTSTIGTELYDFTATGEFLTAAAWVSSAPTAATINPTITLSETDENHGIIIAIKPAGGTDAQGHAWTAQTRAEHPVWLGTSTETEGNPDPPSVTASWGSADNLFIAAAGVDAVASVQDITAAPSGYTGFAEINSDTLGGSGPCIAAVAWEVFTAATQDPGVFTLTGTGGSGYSAATIVIRPLAGSAEGGPTPSVASIDLDFATRTRTRTAT